MDKGPLVSVVISTYDRPILLQKALLSVQAQSMKDFECLVVDDCSPQAEKNAEVVASLNDPRFRYIKTEKNYGHDGHPKNVGISEAKGEYVCFLDDDDSYRVDALKVLSTYLEDSEAEACYGDYMIGGKPGWSVDFNANILQKMNYIAMCVVMVRRGSLLNVGGFDESVPKFKDWNLWLRLQKSGARFIHVPIMVADVSVQEISISNRNKVKHDENGQYLPVIIKEDGKEHTLFDPVDCTIFPQETMFPKRALSVAVYTLTWNRLELTKLMAESLKTAGYPFDWFVVDQGSTDGTVEWLKDQKATVQYNEKNTGLAEGWNQAFQMIKDAPEKYDILIKIDNDARMLTEGWLKAMVELFERNATLVLSPYVEGLEATPGGVMRQRADGGSPYFIIHETVLGAVPNIGGICFAHRADLIKDWKFVTTYQGNKDYLLCQYAKALGYTCFYMEEYRVEHQLTTSGQKEKYPAYFQDASNDSVKSL